jgi:hypothetical protein
MGFINITIRISHIPIRIWPKCEEIDGRAVLESIIGGSAASG